jgi:predicted nuclease of predicted toxin-antitoxin system
MKIKLDENLPLRLAGILKAMGHDVDTLHAEALLGRDDSQVWEAVQRDSRFLITQDQDMDFSDLRRFAPGSHHGILLARLRSSKRRDLIRRIEELFRKEEIEEWSRYFVVATASKVRVLKPSQEQHR